MNTASATKLFGVTLTVIFLLNQVKKTSVGARDLVSGKLRSTAPISSKGDEKDLGTGGPVISIIA